MRKLNFILIALTRLIHLKVHDVVIIQVVMQFILIILLTERTMHLIPTENLKKERRAISS